MQYLGTDGSSLDVANIGKITDANIALSDITTNDVTTARHGFCPKAPNSTSVFLRGDASWGTPTASAANPWDGKVVGAYGSGDPNMMMELIANTGVVSPTPTNISTSVARISYFRLPQAITVNTIRYYGVGAVTTTYRCAIYNGDTLARLTTELVFTTPSAAFGSITVSGGLTLSAGQLYFMAVAVNATGTTAGVAAFGTTIAATTGQIAILPKSYPGRLNIDSLNIFGGLAQFTVTSGALPATAPTIAAQGAWTGGMPAFFLEN